MTRNGVCAEPGCPRPCLPGDPRCGQHRRPRGGKRGAVDWHYRTKTRRAVLDRDRYRCVDCGATGVPLDVDHLDRIRDGHPLDASPDRLQTVCQPCHREREAARNAEQPHR